MIAREEPEEIVTAILSAGVNVASRDIHGMTARDFAVRLQRPHYAKLIDNHVLKLIKSKEFLKVSFDLEKLKLDSLISGAVTDRPF